MTNKAQAELQSLLDMQAQGEAAASNSTRLLEARSNPEFVSKGGKADFALPEALATAVGAGWLLGPVGGLLMGVAQGILGKREEQNAIDAFARDMGVLEETNSIFNDELDRLAATATNPNDLEQLSAMQTQKDVALRMMQTPGLYEQGASLLSDFNTRLNDYTLTQETQRIEAEAADAQLKRELDNTQYSRYVNSKTRFDDESQTYLDVMQATDIALDALANGSPADLWAAGILVNKALDPVGVVREEEAAAVGRLGSLWEKANVIMEKARSGETILPEQRRELSSLLYSIRETGTKFQLAREARYSDEVNDIELPAKYHDNFRIARTVPAAAPGEIEAKTLPAEDIAQAASDAVFPFTDQGIALNLKHLLSGSLNSEKSEEEKRAELAEALQRNPAR